MFLLVPLGSCGKRLGGACSGHAPRPQTVYSGVMKWVVVRQDTHGTRFDMAEFDSQAEAQAMVDRFESGYPHHQTYYIERRPD